jgi:predicted DNA-binding transcriptional regulator AlpA
MAQARRRDESEQTEMDLGALLRASEVAQVLGVTPKRVYSLVGHIAVRCAPRTMRWRPVDVQSWIEAHRSKS